MTNVTSWKEQIKALVEIQELDLQIDSMNQKKMSLPVQLRELDKKIATFRDQITKKETEIGEFEKISRQARAAIDLNNDRMKRSTQNLGAARNAQEYNAANREAEQLKKMNATLEEQIAKATADKDAAAKIITEIQEQLAIVQGERDTKAAEVSSLDSVIGKDLSELDGKRGLIAKSVHITTLSRYNRVRQARGGLGIAVTTRGSCSACHTVIPHQMFNELQKAIDSHACPRCHRFLYFSVPA